MIDSIFGDFLARFNKKNFEIGKDSYGRWYISLSFFSTLYYLWLDRPNVNESYFKQIVDTTSFVDGAYFTKYVYFFKSKFCVKHKVGDKIISTNIREFDITSEKSVYFLVLSEK
jgi:hypothetical protein